MQRAFLSFNCEFQYVRRVLNGHCRPPLGASRIATKGEIKLKIFSGKLFTYFAMRWGSNDGVCRNYAVSDVTPYILVKVLRNFEKKKLPSRTEYAGNSSLRVVGTIYQTTRRHIPNYRNFNTVKCFCYSSFSRWQITDKVTIHKTTPISRYGDHTASFELQEDHTVRILGRILTNKGMEVIRRRRIFHNKEPCNLRF